MACHVGIALNTSKGEGVPEESGHPRTIGEQKRHFTWEVSLQQEVGQIEEELSNLNRPMFGVSKSLLCHTYRPSVSAMGICGFKSPTLLRVLHQIRIAQVLGRWLL